MRLADWMALTGTTDRILAERLGVSSVAVLRYRRGERTPHWDILARLFEVTGGAVAPNDFLPKPPQVAERLERPVRVA